MLYIPLLTLLPLLPLSLSAAVHSDSQPRSQAHDLEARKKGGGWPDYPEVIIHPYASNLYKDGVRITGTHDDEHDQDVFLGIPYAEPPTGANRWRRPLPYNYTNDVKAQSAPPACPQDIKNPYIGTDKIDEDCLFLNVWAPDDAKPEKGSKEAKEPIPVIVYLHPGGWDSGSGIAYNGTNLVAYSQEREQPVIYVSLNYRLGVLGWPYGYAFDQARAANLGLRDVLQALRWIKENICYSGGDPHRVTLHGHSAGSVMISQLYFDTEMDLFSSAIMSSGAPSTAPIGPTNGTWDRPYELFLNETDCYTPYGGDIGCLKNVSAADILAAQLSVKRHPEYTSSFIYGPSVDLDLIPDQPWILLEKGIFAPIPYIQGQTKDEGTGFTPTNITEDTIMDVLQRFEPSPFPDDFDTNLTERWYPNDPDLGAPFGTHNETFGLDPAYKQFAAIFTDAVHTGPRRHFIRQNNEFGFNRTWTYTFDHRVPGVDPRFGVVHLSDLPYILGDIQAGENQWTQGDEDLSDLIRGYWLNFTYYGNPNGPNFTNPYTYPDPYNQNGTVPPPATEINSTYWTEHDLLAGRKDILKFEVDDTEIIQDNYREGSVRFINDHWDEFNY
ncbi:hypothetical protein IAT40_004369 [Kwoniella sp. CBS 6097]